ncbi:patatin-like phospholipase domain-containing protein 7 [Paramacrobiotus metropolitanus]|uniref:patatin-like phospholipase domain-containing protein 7 n=1 Tax=Paramacrobiotus metropolitanus TaxID=2943436 RepID=UPI002445DE8B|nr:patatin-like phospholipase domain-containing protein 7 [Paramacrobiotus metropolitanus]
MSKVAGRRSSTTALLTDSPAWRRANRAAEHLLQLITKHPWIFLLLLSILIAYVVYISCKKVRSTNATRTVPGKASASQARLVPVPSTTTSHTPSFHVDEAPALLADADKRAELRIGLLRSIRIFGDVFEDADIINMAKSLQIIRLQEGEVLCKPGEPDQFIYVLQEGKLMLSCLDTKSGQPSPIRVVEKGESIYSILNIMEAFAGRGTPVKSCGIAALEDSYVAKFPMAMLVAEVARDSQHMLRVVQLIMMWLHRVLFVALFNFLGLSHEIFLSRQSATVSRSSGERKMSSFSSYADRDRQLLQEGRIGEVEVLQPDRDFRAAINDLNKQFQLPDSTLLEKKVSYLSVPAGTLIVQANEPDTPLLYVAAGCLSAWSKKPEEDGGGDLDESMVEVFQVVKGELLGGLAVLSGEPMLFQIETKLHSKLIAIHRSDFYEILPLKPSMVYSIALSEIARLSPFMRQTDFGLDWVHINAGHPLYRLGEEPLALFIVLAGRLRSMIYREENREFVEDLCRGDLVGLVEVSVQCPRQTTVIAVRDSEVAKIPVALLDLIKARNPKVVSRLIRALGTGIVTSIHKANENFVAEGLPRTPSRPESMTTIAVVPCDGSAPFGAFAAELEGAFNAICKTVRITSEDVKRNIGSRALQPVGAARLSAWLSQKEDENRIVLYQSDGSLTLWTLRCLRQADCILLVGLGDGAPELNEVDHLLRSSADSIRARKDLVLLHKMGSIDTSRTHDWLTMHTWCALLHHVACPERMFQKRRRSTTASLPRPPPEKHSDLSRLARILTGTAVGLVLGGGGARGFSHIGLVEALGEADIPIDMIGGVSMGAFVAALWALLRDIKEVRRRGKAWAVSASSSWNMLRELTYPYMAIFRGGLFNRSLREALGEGHIEQLWIPYFTASTDLTDVTLRIHTRGSLWRYVRASMTIVGYLPPLCDPEDGHLLVDGGYMNNVPADVMRQRGAGIILAVDVGRETVRQTFDYGDEFNGWSTLIQRFSPWAAPLLVPNITELQSRLAYVRSTWILAGLKKARWCTYLRPPITSYQTLEFTSFDEITDVGYYFGQMTLAEGLLRGKITDTERQLLTTSFGLYIANRRPQPIIGQYLNDLASFGRTADTALETLDPGDATLGVAESRSLVELAPEVRVGTLPSDTALRRRERQRRPSISRPTPRYMSLNQHLLPAGGHMAEVPSHILGVPATPSWWSEGGLSEESGAVSAVSEDDVGIVEKERTLLDPRLLQPPGAQPSNESSGLVESSPAADGL